MAPGVQGSVVIDVAAVTKSYGSGRGRVDALRGVDLTVHEGEIVAIVGQSGSGKTTLLQMLGAVDVPTSGTVEVAGNDLASMRERDLTGFRRSVVGFVFQQFNLIPTLTAYQNVEAAAVNLQGGGAPADRIADLLTQVGLGDRMDHRPAELSGGEQQRVAIARALVRPGTRFWNCSPGWRHRGSARSCSSPTTTGLPRRRRGSSPSATGSSWTTGTRAALRVACAAD